MSQKIELFELTSALYAERYRKFERGLKRIDKDEVKELNKDLYNFLNYCLAYQQADDESQQKWETEILASSASEVYMKRKAQLFDL